MTDLLRWHGAEEVEHRSVAHDLFTHHLDARYLRRIRSLMIGGPVLLRLRAAGVAHLCRHDPALRGTRAARVRLRDYLRASRRGLAPGPLLLARATLSYLNPRYRPSHHGSTDDAVAYLATSPAARAAEAGERGAHRRGTSPNDRSPAVIVDRVRRPCADVAELELVADPGAGRRRRRLPMTRTTDRRPGTSCSTGSRTRPRCTAAARRR